MRTWTRLRTPARSARHRHVRCADQPSLAGLGVGVGTHLPGGWGRAARLSDRCSAVLGTRWTPWFHSDLDPPSMVAGRASRAIDQPRLRRRREPQGDCPAEDPHPTLVGPRALSERSQNLEEQVVPPRDASAWPSVGRGVAHCRTRRSAAFIHPQFDQPILRNDFSEALNQNAPGHRRQDHTALSD